MKILRLKQGSPEWIANRKTTRNASDAPAMMGTDNKTKRSELIHIYATGAEKEFSDWVQKNIIDKGHKFEARARALLEEDLGITLYPLSATDDDGYLGASSDGCTLPPKGGMGFEHKQWNEELAESVRSGIVPDSHSPQLDQQIAVFEFDSVLFVVSDGTREKRVMCEYRTTPEKVSNILAGWKLFDEDVAKYQPSEDEARPILVANPLDHLPALIVEVTGMVTHSNLVEFKDAANAVIGSIKTELVTDQDFVDATAAVKYLKDVEDKAKHAKQNALDQTTSIADLFSALDDVIDMAGKVRRALDKKITDEKDRRKAEIILAAKNELAEHAAALNKRIHGLLPAVACDFAAPLKGLKSLDSMKDKIAGALANAKIDANATADRIEANVSTLTPEEGTNWRFLFPDLGAVCGKAPDDFAALLASRLAAHQAAEEKRLAAERERIRQEEAQKLAAQAAVQTPPVAQPDPAEAQAVTPAVPRAIVAAPVKAIESTATGKLGRELELIDLIDQMTEDELQLVVHYCERLIEQREDAA